LFFSILGASGWLGRFELQDQIGEKIAHYDFKTLIDTLTRVIEHPYSYIAKDFIFKYRKILPATSTLEEIPAPELEEDGRKFITVKG